MPGYLVETYLARGDAAQGDERARRVRLAADAPTGSGNPVRFKRAIHLPEDEMCFYLFEAASEADVSAAARRAGLEPVRIVPAVPSEWEERP